MQEINLRPVDWFYFKDHSVAEAGNSNENVLNSMFPPRPNTIYGALCSAYIHKHSTFEKFYQQSDKDVQKWMGTKEERGSFSLKAMFLKKDNHFLLPLPLDFQVTKGKTEEAIMLERKKVHVPSNYQQEYALYANSQNKKLATPAGTFAILDDWKRALVNQEKITHLISLNKIIETKRRAGTRLNVELRRAEESHLFNRYQLYLNEGYSLSVLTDSAPDFENIRFAQVGGASRPWIVKAMKNSFTIWTNEEKEIMKEKIVKERVAKIHLLTPTIWDNGSKPGKCDNDGWWRLNDDVEVKWLTAAIGRPKVYGGWDIANNRPKQRLQMVPEGSVIYVEVPTSVNIDPFLDGFNVADYGKGEGFGFAIMSC